MRPDGGGRPGNDLVERLAASFGSLSGFKGRFAGSATGRFGSGWAWLTQAGDGASDLLRIESSAESTWRAWPQRSVKERFLGRFWVGVERML
jgi:superoxide dismutase